MRTIQDHEAPCVEPLSRCWIQWIQCCSVAVAVWRTTNSAWYSDHCWRVAAKKSFLEPVFDIIWSYLVWLVGWLVVSRKKIERHQGSSWQKRLNIAKPPLWHQAFQTGGLWQRLRQRLRNIPGLKVCSQQHILLIKHSNEKDLFKHLRTRPNVRPCPPNLTPIQCYVFVTKGWTETLVVRSDFDFVLAGLGV